ncbi:hypothetical protein E2C01_062650 [Portunus trituberculatus]|uniref:Uncharacterized protein n=1 Tax=Portunus trituberculatus TaxID=210409 RepID=A0A5B7HGN3_PORTR|nr:hypothetical protein [Portunus trituberculatus]
MYSCLASWHAVECFNQALWCPCVVQTATFRRGRVMQCARGGKQGEGVTAAWGIGGPAAAAAASTVVEAVLSAPTMLRQSGRTPLLPAHSFGYHDNQHTTPPLIYADPWRPAEYTWGDGSGSGSQKPL